MGEYHPRRCTACGIEVERLFGGLTIVVKIGGTWQSLDGGEWCSRTPHGHHLLNPST